MVRTLIVSLLLFSVTPVFGGWFGPSTPQECLEEHRDDVVYPGARSSVNRACKAAYTSEGRLIFDLGTDKRTAAEYRAAAECYLKKSSSKELRSKESALKAAADCSDSRRAFHFLTWSYNH